MKFSLLFRDLVGEQFPRLFLQVENDLLLYLKGFLGTLIELIRG
jgi:hypothetical protein